MDLLIFLLLSVLCFYSIHVMNMMWMAFPSLNDVDNGNVDDSGDVEMLYPGMGAA